MPDGLLTSITVQPAGVTYLNFADFVSVFTLSVPWFTSGYSYCRWWGVTCCLTSSESVLPTCTAFQSVGTLTLSGMLTCQASQRAGMLVVLQKCHDLTHLDNTGKHATEFTCWPAHPISQG